MKSFRGFMILFSCFVLTQWDAHVYAKDKNPAVEATKRASELANDIQLQTTHQPKGKGTTPNPPSPPMHPSGPSSPGRGPSIH